MKNDRSIKLPGSKSILNRVLLISTYLQSPLKIINSSNCSDIKTMITNTRKLGFNIIGSANELEIKPQKNIIKKASLLIKDSGTASRFLTARLASFENLNSKIDVSMQLKQRPIAPLITVLQKMGAKIADSNIPININGDKLSGGKFEIPGNISSQFISALLLIAPSYNNDLEIEIKGKIVSRTYIDMTISIMKDFGIDVEFSNNNLSVRSGQKYMNPVIYKIEPDYSSAAYFWALGAFTDFNFSIEINEVNSIQADFKFLNVLQQMGANIKSKGNLIKVCKSSLNGIEADMQDMPDQVPTLAILALFANSKTIINNISHLKYKESNRIEALVSNINRLGGKIIFKGDSLEVYPLNKKPDNIEIDTYNDHRIAMAFSLLKAKYNYLRISNLDSIEKSYPEFLLELSQIIDIS